MTKKLLFAFILCTSILNAQTIVNIPDANFKAALLESPTINFNGDNEIQLSEAQAYNGNLNVSNKNISDLTGIEAFTEIISLTCSNNQLSQLDVSANTKLTKLYCTDNLLTSLNTSNNIELTVLWCQRNQITAIDVANNVLLTQLSCANNALTNLDVTTLTALEFLNFNDNSVSSIDVTFNTDLNSLSFFNNNISTLDVSSNINLENLNLQSNSVPTLDLANNVNLKTLKFGSNPITSIDLSTNVLLENLSCQFVHGITELDLSNNTSFNYLLFSSNNLTTIDLRNGNNANITYFAVLNANSLECIYVDNKAYSDANWNNPNPGMSSFVETEAECNAVLSLDNLEVENFRIYPNPTSTFLQINSNSSLNKATIYTVLGKKVLESNQKNINVESLNNGVYFLKIEDKNKNTVIKQFIKQ